MKNKWRNYALKDGKVKDSYIREYCNRKKVRKAGKASDCNSVQQSGEKQAEEEVKLVYKPPTHYQVRTEPLILNDAWVVNLREPENKLYLKDEGEENGKSETGIGKPIQSSGEECGKVGSIKPRSRSRRRRNEKIREGKDGEDGSSR